MLFLYPYPMYWTSDRDLSLLLVTQFTRFCVITFALVQLWVSNGFMWFIPSHDLRGCIEHIETLQDSSVGWPNSGPTSALSSRRWPNVSPTYKDYYGPSAYEMTMKAMGGINQYLTTNELSCLDCSASISVSCCIDESQTLFVNSYRKILHIQK